MEELREKIVELEVKIQMRTMYDRGLVTKDDLDTIDEAYEILRKYREKPPYTHLRPQVI